LAPFSQFCHFLVNVLLHFLFVLFVNHCEKLLGDPLANLITRISQLLFGCCLKLAETEGLVAANFLGFEVPFEPLPHVFGLHLNLFLVNGIRFQALFHKNVYNVSGSRYRLSGVLAIADKHLVIRESMAQHIEHLADFLSTRKSVHFLSHRVQQFRMLIHNLYYIAHVVLQLTQVNVTTYQISKLAISP
jgi:hypothetical protein